MSGIETLIRRYFPYDVFRRYQWEIAKSIYDALSSGKVALIEALRASARPRVPWLHHWLMQRRVALRCCFSSGPRMRLRRQLGSYVS
ncbi:hypothetical protein [Vulcanisaeta distributa]|uniref:hypothetical protein n=1 Tax=Vulcanisaeta distributa TaxID=164451 RepID=UPI001FB45B55|nr:hypothetical protein [Vulcanisaeta distributa]